jgi:DNA mismatch endonuclease (patch repair protein)
MDRLTKEKRSWNMSRIGPKDTSPELIVRSTLHRLGYRFRLHVKKLPGKPDIVLAKHRTVIFVHGCFWHRHKGCKYAYTPKTRQEFWTEKFRKNVEQHERVMEQLAHLGWNTIIVWGCEVSNAEALGQRLLTLRENPGQPAS